jgi:hypothetical protein
MLEQDEIPAEQVFARFRKYAEAKLDDVATAESLLVALRRDADTFRGFADLLVIVLSAIEQKRRTEKNENVTLPSKLQIEHVMPQKWRINWSDGLLDDPVASAQRDRVIHTIGNLTLVSGSLNASLSNRPWRDSDAAVVAPTGPEAGKGKRSLIDKHSLLVLNKEIVQGRADSWSESDIKARGLAMTKDIAAIWPRG